MMRAWKWTIWGLLFLPMCLLGAGHTIQGKVGLAGVRIYPDRGFRPESRKLPETCSDAQGNYQLELDDQDQRLVLEKAGFFRELLPKAEWDRPIRLKPAPSARVEKAWILRLHGEDGTDAPSDAELRRMLFSRAAGFSSLANYLYEVSKGLLELQEGQWLELKLPSELLPPTEARRPELTRWILQELKRRVPSMPPLLDQIHNRSGASKPDGKPDHLWILTPGAPASLSFSPKDLDPQCVLAHLPWDPLRIWPLILIPELSPLGIVAHEVFHAMGEHRVEDLYRPCGEGQGAGIWDLMDAGMYMGWEGEIGKAPWAYRLGFSPSHPGPWIRSERWYAGFFKVAVPQVKMKGRLWEGWLDPLIRAPGVHPQVLRVPDPRKKDRYWEFSVRRSWGFDGGRIGGRPRLEGLLVAQVDPSKAGNPPQGPVRVLDARPRTSEPEAPRLPCHRWELDDAPYPSGQAGKDAALHWKVLEETNSGAMKIRVELRP